MLTKHADLAKDKNLIYEESIVATRHTPDSNRDPITGTPGAHPVATGVGTAVGGAAAGAAGGAVGGPIGAAVGAVVGGIVGGAAGAALGEEVDPVAEDRYWRETYPTRPYYAEDVSYDEVLPAYRYGWESRERFHDQSFDDAENTLQAGWEETEHDARLGWEMARDAVRDAWDHAGAKPRRVPR